MGGPHLVWDWNGTLLDDLIVVIEAANVSLALLGAGPIDEDGYRDHFTRPVRAFYDSLLGRPVADSEWDRLNATFHDEYYSRVDKAPLTGDALEALGLAERTGWSQSLLSMSPQSWLERVVASKGLPDRFLRVDGLSGPTGGLKADHLAEHVAALDLDPGRVVVVGDTPDDAAAAGEVGTRVVLYNGGSHHLPLLEGLGHPVAHSLMEAVTIAGRMR